MVDLGVTYGKTLCVSKISPCDKSEKAGCSANSLWGRCFNETKLNRVCFNECENNKNRIELSL
jgi:hypothetical protein